MLKTWKTTRIEETVLLNSKTKILFERPVAVTLHYSFYALRLPKCNWIRFSMGPASSPPPKKSDATSVISI